MKIIRDKEGNEIISERREGQIFLDLNLKGQKKRALGTIIIATKIFETQRNREKHLMLVNKSYGFNYKIIKEAKLFDTIKLDDNYGRYIIPREEILNKGEVLNFGKSGFELQIFYPISELQKWKY